MKSYLIAVLPVFVLFLGCGNQDSGGKEGPNTDGSAFLLKSEPASSVGISQAKKDVKDGDSVTLVGRIGGSKEPFNATLANFTIVDLDIPHCPPEEGCPHPWDYCCTQNQVTTGSASVDIVGTDGEIVASEPKSLLGVKELDVVVVEGTAKLSESGQLSVLAKKVFVRK